MPVRRTTGGQRAAFTLLELVVVGAIVAVVGVVTVATVSRMQRVSRSVTCQANLAQILQGIVAYNLDNTGYFPYGFYFGPALITWVDVIDPYLGGAPPKFSALFQCPEAQQVGVHPVSYVMNMIVAIAPEFELVVGDPPNAQQKPSKTSRMLDDGTALIWDTPVQPNWAHTYGYLVGADVDNQRFWMGAQTPQFRYYSPSDPFSQIRPGTFGNNRSANLGIGFLNVDPPANSNYPYQGNLRFRHGAGNVCNAGFSDGSVRLFTATIGSGNTVIEHDALRRYFMTHWPPGAVPDPAFPFGGEPHPPVRDPGR